ncbi:hypothetical protein LBE40_05290 [Bartonella taylorii]|uniref:Uncharacterized protein n=1 Tax=Bartonella taylorii 8TBB TaxID=1094560 RepID=A0A9P2RYS2_BARTA|nr:hypothetical protein [Bartonella taylorii]EJF92874.1 hypothetical protein ME9_01489 [Bartonella taylorii 8TBB]USP00714.1 hypothetical protein LBE40_05290 [Bartonella taylorii]
MFGWLSGWSNTGLSHSSSNAWSDISSINFSSSGSQPGCTVGDYLSTANSYGGVGRDIGTTDGVFVGGIVGGLTSGGWGIIPGAGVGVGLGYGAGVGVGLNAQYNACYY